MSTIVTAARMKNGIRTLPISRTPLRCALAAEDQEQEEPHKPEEYPQRGQRPRQLVVEDHVGCRLPWLDHVVAHFSRRRARGSPSAVVLPHLPSIVDIRPCKRTMQDAIALY